MAYRLDAFGTIGLTDAFLKVLLEEHAATTLPRLERLWMYYRNPMRPASGTNAERWSKSGRWYRLAQEAGLPPRLAGVSVPGFTLPDDRAAARREIVIENDIGWRVQAMVDFMFGKPVKILSTARRASTRRMVDRALDTVWETSGGIALLQDMALLGQVFGHVDLVLRAGGGQRPDAAANADALERALRVHEPLSVEIVEPRRGIPVVDPHNYRGLVGYVLSFPMRMNEAGGAGRSMFARLLSRTGVDPGRRVAQVVEVLSGEARQVYVDGELAEQQSLEWTLGRLPVVHVQNTAQPFCYEGQSDVEALIPLQDELNTRLSDRASRVTMQSFKMYLAKGIDGFENSPIGPGQIWSTDNTDAKIESFGGDAESPAEAAHIQEIREALDKASGVPPLASGVVRAKIGNLTSANALKITMMGLLARTARKRVTYGRGIEQMSRLILGALDHLNILKTAEADRGVKLVWPDPLPVDVREQVEAARVKAELGVDKDEVLGELGHDAVDPGVE